MIGVFCFGHTRRPVIGVYNRGVSSGGIMRIDFIERNSGERVK